MLDQRPDLIGTPRLVVADPVVDAALQGANRSYAPYTKDFSGVALECEDGRVYSGGYEENAAYDPGVSPFQAEFAVLLLGVGPWPRAPRSKCRVRSSSSYRWSHRRALI